MLQGDHSAILLTFIKLPYVIKIFVLSICKWPLKTGFTVSVPRNHFIIANSVDPDDKVHSAASHLGLHWFYRFPVKTV